MLWLIKTCLVSLLLEGIFCLFCNNLGLVQKRVVMEVFGKLNWCLLVEFISLFVNGELTSLVKLTAFVIIWLGLLVRKCARRALVVLKLLSSQ